MKIMKNRISVSLLAIIFLLVAYSCKKEKSLVVTPNPNPDNWPTDDIRTVASGLSFPWEILWGKDDYIWLTERGGKITRMDPKTGTVNYSTTISDVVTNGEGGLLGMVQHPDFLSNGYLYIVYNYNKNGKYTEKALRLTFKNNALTDPLTIIDDIAAAGIHNGSRLWITSGGDPKLFITTGDAANPALAQNTGALNGKVLRVNLDGSIPADNPISGSPVWSWGHRNQQGFVIANDIVYASEHGASIEDEVNIIEKNRNYGWPSVEGPCDGGETTFCNTNNVKQPIWSTGGNTRAVSGMDYYNNDRIAQWKNSLLVATLKDATIWQLKLAGDGKSVASVKTYFTGNWGRLRDVCVSPAGRVYLCTSNGGGNDKLIEINKPE